SPPATPSLSLPDALPISVVVLNDVTRLRRLEKVRQEFVANVSHELKTPITSIKGYVETILAGDMSPEDRQRFLEIVKRQADRLRSEEHTSELQSRENLVC